MMKDLDAFKPWLPPVVAISVHIISIFVLLFFGVFHILFESFWIGVACFVTLMFAVFSLISLLNQENTGSLQLCFVSCAAITLVIASYVLGVRGLIYCFPLSGAAFFIMRFRPAVIYGGSIILACTIAVLHSMEFVLVVRFFMAMAMSFIFSGTLAYHLFKQKKQLEQEANEDYLTGLMNRRSFYTWLEGFLEESSGYKKRLTLFYFDIDQFKSINDSFGHAGGDLVLKEFARRIGNEVEALRQEYCTGGEMFFCRLSGDEFVLACPSTSNSELAAIVAKRFHEALAAPFSIGGRMALIRASIGAHHFVIENQSAAEVMQVADSAMYKAKKSGEQQFYISEDQNDDFLRDGVFSY